METPDTNIFPEIGLGIIDAAKSVGKRLVGLCTYFPPNDVPLHRSNHYQRSHFEPQDGDAAQAQLPFEESRG